MACGSRRALGDGPRGTQSISGPKRFMHLAKQSAPDSPWNWKICRPIDPDFHHPSVGIYASPISRVWEQFIQADFSAESNFSSNKPPNTSEHLHLAPPNRVQFDSSDLRTTEPSSTCLCPDTTCSRTWHPNAPAAIHVEPFVFFGRLPSPAPDGGPVLVWRAGLADYGGFVREELAPRREEVCGEEESLGGFDGRQLG